MLNTIITRALLLFFLTFASSSWAACVQGFVSGLYFVSNCSPDVLVRIVESIPNEASRQRFRDYVRQAYQSGDTVSADVLFSVSPLVSQVGGNVSRSEVYEQCEDGSNCAQRTIYYITEYQTIAPAKSFEREFGFTPKGSKLTGSIHSNDVPMDHANISSGVARSGLVAVQLIQSGALENLGDTFKAHWKVLLHGAGPDEVAEQSLGEVKAEAKALLSLAQAEIHVQSELYLGAGERLEQDFEILKVRATSITSKLLESLRSLPVSIADSGQIQSIEIQVKELSKASLAPYKTSDNLLRELQIGLIPALTIDGHRRNLQQAVQDRTNPTALSQQIVALQRLARIDKNVHRQEQYKNLLNAYVDEQGLLASAMGRAEREIVGTIHAGAETALGQALRDNYNEVLSSKSQFAFPEQHLGLLSTLKSSDAYFARGDRATGNLLLNRVRAFLDYQQQDPRVTTYRAVQATPSAAQTFPGLKSPANSFGEYQALQFANQLTGLPGISNQDKTLGQEIVRDIIAAEKAGDVTSLLERTQAGQIVLGVKSTMPKLRNFVNLVPNATAAQTRAAEKSMKLLDTAVSRVSSKEDVSAQMYYDLGMALADLALGLAPGVGWAKDVYEATTGLSLVTGQKLSGFEQSMAVIGVLTAGVGSKFSVLAKGTVIRELMRVGRIADDVEDGVLAVDRASKIVDSAKNIRSQMSNLGEAIPGTSIPKYFRLKTEGAEFFVNPNATKHMGEYINSLPPTHGLPLRNDLIISSFESGVKEAVRTGAWKTSLESGNPIISGGWELIFSKRPTDELPVIIHALMKK